MRYLVLALITLLLFGSCTSSAYAEGYRPLVFAHYMPWYVIKEYSGVWGWHWTMNTMNPDILLAGNRRQIASHYYPTIGPYDSADPALIEYHLMLMKLSGIDGIFIDWYGTHNVYDYPVIRKAVENLVGILEKTDLRFAIVYEDRTLENVVQMTAEKDPVKAAAQDLIYLSNRFFNSPNYLKVNSQPLLLNFGPIFMKDYNDWQRVFLRSGIQPAFAVLNYQNPKDTSGKRWFTGEFGWVDTPSRTLTWYRYSQDMLQIGPALPGFNDFYVQGGVAHGSLNQLADRDGATLQGFLALAQEQKPPIVQLITWNDFGEGTNIEPTLEYGYRYLADIQRFTQSSYTEDDLRLAQTFYGLRKSESDLATQVKLTDVFQLVMASEVDRAREMLTSIK